ncbi:MAG: MipA/OmpV family protein [Pseudomonadota bacterium]
MTTDPSRATRFMLSTRLAIGFALACALAFAADNARAEPLISDPIEQPSAANSIQFELGAGAGVGAAYEGSKDFRFSPVPIIRLRGLDFGRISFGGGATTGFSIAPSFRYVGKRSAADHPELAGIQNLDPSYEAGLKLGYEWEYARAFVQARYGFGGHKGFVGEVGADAIVRPDSTLSISVGPRLSFANDKYAHYHFSVPVTATNLAPYVARGGIKSAGVAVKIRKDFNDQWAAEAEGSYDRLVGNFATSPIVQAGSRNQYAASLSLIRKFDLKF